MRKLTVDWRLFAVAMIGAVFITIPSTVGAQTAPRLCDGVEVTILGTPGDDVIRGTDGPDVIAGLQGDDLIEGMGGDDIICAGIGNDVIFGNSGFDIIFGAQGDDLIHASDGILSDGTFSRDRLRADERGARMFGGAGNDVIHGSDRWDRMQGGAGQDQLYGYEGRDWMRGGAGTDLVDGGIGIDDLHGGNGADVIRITSSDVVRGGAGLDRCIVNGTGHQLRSCEPNATVAIPLTAARNRGLTVSTSECRGVVDDEALVVGRAVQLAQGVVTNSTDENYTVQVDIVAFDDAGREVTWTASDFDLVQSRSSTNWRPQAIGDRAVGVEADDFTTCIVSITEASTNVTRVVSGEEFNVETTCEVTQVQRFGTTLHVVSGSITNTTDEARQIAMFVTRFDENGRAVSFSDLPVADGMEIAPGQTVMFEAFRTGDLPEVFSSRCTTWVFR